MRDLSTFLLPLAFPPANMPKGKIYEDDTSTSQARCDAQYLDQLNGYFDRGDSYISTDTLLRNSSKFPKSYPRIPFGGRIPQRQIVSWTPNDWGSADMTLTYAPVDTRIVPPVIPEWTETATVNGGPLAGHGGYTPLADPVAVLKPMLQALLDHFGITV